MKRFLMAVALTGVVSLTALAGNVPTSDYVSPGNVPTGDFVAAPGNVPTNDVVAPPASASNTLVNTVVVNLVLTITNLIGR